MNDFLAHALPTLAKFAIAMAVIGGVTAACRRLRFPTVVGLLLTGVLFGPHGLGVVGEHRPVADFFAELGKLLLMFFAGLEIDLTQFRKARKKSITFGLVTTSVPLILGTIVGLFFGRPLVPAIVLGSLLASHTLLAASTIVNLGLLKYEPITITFGATVISDTLSLIVFAVCVSIFKTGFSASAIGLQLLEIVTVIPLMIWTLSRLSAFLKTKLQDKEELLFVAMLAIVAVAGLIAQGINLPDIVGAFLAGLSINAAVKGTSAKEKLEFLGNSLFIPVFFIATGFLINPSVFWNSLMSQFPLALSVIGALLIGKAIAAQSVGRIYGYSSAARMTMWSLTLPQVAATLAAALVAYQVHDPSGKPLLDVEVLNVVFVLMLSTSILGPVMTERYAPKFLKENSAP